MIIFDRISTTIEFIDLFMIVLFNTLFFPLAIVSPLWYNEYVATEKELRMREEEEVKMTIWDAWAQCRIKPTPVGTRKTPHNPPDPHTIPSFGDIVALTEEGRKEAQRCNPESLVGLALKGEDLTTQGKVVYRSDSGYWIECSNDDFEECLVRPWNLINYGPEPDPYFEGWKGEAK